MITSSKQVHVRPVPAVLLALSLALSGGCDRMSGVFGSASESSARLSEAVADTSKAVGEAAADAVARMGTSDEPKTHVAGSPPAPPRPSGRAAGTKVPAPKAETPSETAAAAAAPQDEEIAGLARALAEAAPELDAPVASQARAEPHAIPLETAALPVSRLAPAVAARNDRIYSSEDTDVTPAVLLTTSEAGPMFRGITPSLNTMELLISPTGKVEQVRLLSPTVRMTDMLLLSGAKTWTFAPALKDGQPVRYRTMFSWESTP